jgi:ferric-dicitrate binding protein FerR (iron transport regulator)
MSNESFNDQADADEARIAAAIRAAALSTPSAAARQRVESAVHAAWRDAVQESSSATEQVAVGSADSAATRRLRRWSMAAGVAALAVFAGFAWRANAPQVQVAQIESVAGAVGVESLGWLSSERQIAAAAPVALHDQLTVGSTGMATIRMPSGLSIRMRAGTRLAFLAQDQVRLDRGTVYVDAVPGSDPDFTVQTAVGSVRHLGTQYQVESDGQQVTVAVRDGAVAVAIDGRAIERADAGSVVSIGATDRQVLRTSVARFDERFAWIEAQPTPFALDGARLGDFLAWFTRETGIEVRFAPVLNSQQLAAVTLRGSVEGLAPLKALDVVLSSTDLTYANFDGAIVITSR